MASPSAPLTSTVSSSSGHFQVRRSFACNRHACICLCCEQWTEWQCHVQAPSSAMSVRQLVQWLTQTQHLPVKILQYEGFPPLYNDLEALNESAMEMVRFMCVCVSICYRLHSTVPCRNLSMQLFRKRAVVLSKTAPTLISALSCTFKAASRTARCLACASSLIRFECRSFHSLFICARLINKTRRPWGAIQPRALRRWFYVTACTLLLIRA